MFGVKRAVRRLLELPTVERKLLLEASVLLPLVHAAQTVAPFRRWRGWFTVASQVPARRELDLTPEHIAMAIERARKGMPGVYKCLPQAYAGHLMLHRHGFDSDVQVGVARDSKGAVEAHAWVERDGRVLIGELPDLDRFVPLPPLKV